MFTQRHYIAVAKLFAETRPTDEASFAYAQWRTMLIAFSTKFEADNPKFDQRKFTEACEK